MLFDEIYEHINFSGTFAALHLSRNVRKNNHRKWVAKFHATGWRIGYIGAPEFIAKACTKIQGQVTSEQILSHNYYYSSRC
jgi:aspartate aminotransferase